MGAGPLYPDAITRACTRLDFARVCVMLNINSKLPKHIVIMMPNEHGGESACKVDVEYEWLPPKCTNCTSLGHANKECPLTKLVKPAVSIYVRRNQIPAPAPRTGDLIPTPNSVFDHPMAKDDLVSYERPYQKTDKAPRKFPHVEHTDLECSGPKQEGPSSRRPRPCLRIQMAVFVDCSGPGNRIWIAWNDDFIDVDILNFGSQFVHCRVLMHDMHEPILLTVVYGANEVIARRELWQGLTEMAVSIDLPWLVGGDFNAVLDMSEVSGASEIFGTDGRSLWKRLDRMFVNDAWLGRWPNLFYTCFTPRTSDHSPLVLKGDSRDVQHPVIGTSMYSVTRKLKALKLVFRQLRRKKGDLAMNVKLAAGFLEIAQKLLQADRHNSLLLQLENYCRLVYLKATQLEHVMLRQRAKLQWLKGGDQCSKCLCDLFPRSVGWDRTERAIDLHFLRPWARHILTEEEAYALIHPVTVDDVKTAMFDIEEDKAPGPNGFSSGFYKAAWPIVGEEISKAIMDFFTTGRLLKQVNATILTLIPKVRTQHSVADLRPISCCNVIYKVISKILVCRFREILDLLISPSQNAFVPGRLISDNVLLAQELFSGYNQCRLPPRCALKVDIRKAYDTVEWDFLFATLRLFGFPVVFIRWIEECVTSAHYSVVVNGGVHGFFVGARGLRQGDPMSPYLFVLVMEVL
ncbi:Retrovirus-related Pol polyprotein from type-2 retrotransposable element R2DM [Sesamum angolense]|uniref:Retrovirus-related Pol polyprotein from type-2 retrotransposable element R2DM n=1 Tax=Sesamum angolense TaxID=2727404 RepID=A0AAE1W0J7_9LAMI|nr:Retrovirus-related Pol polyprotein from type-2 retrotransposable element R2DM [Sesamum angolense]